MSNANQEPEKNAQASGCPAERCVIRLAERLKFCRKVNNVTLRDAERHTGINNGYLSQLESGKIKSPSVWTIKTLAKYYNVTIDDLISAV